MKDFLQQISLVSNYEFMDIIEFDGRTYQSKLRLTMNDTFDLEILEFITITRPNFKEPLYIADLQQYLSDHSLNSLLNHLKKTKSLYLKQLISPDKSQIICLASSKTISFSEKDLTILNILCENYELKTLRHTERSNQLNNTEELFQTIFNSVPEAISFHQIPNHKTILVNQAFIDYTGYSREEALNKTGIELDLWVDDEDRIKYRQELEENGSINNFKAKFRLKNGKIGIGFISGKIVLYNNHPHLLLIIRDVSNIEKIQNKLYSSEEKFKKLFDSLPDPVSINKLDNSMTFTDVNQAFLKLAGASKERLLGKSGFDLNFWADPTQRQYYMNEIQKNGSINNFQATYKHPNGKLEKGLISAKTIQIENTPQLLVMLKGIDDLLNMKALLKISEQKFRSIFDSSPDAISINDMKNTVFVDINHSFTEITGYSKQDIIGKPMGHFDLWHSKADAEKYFYELRKNGKINNFETKIRLKNGKVIYTLISAITIKIGSVPHIVNLTRNIDDIRLIQSGLKESEEKFRTIVEKSHASILIIDNKQKFIYTNPKAQFLFGYSQNELQGMNFETILHPDSLEIVKKRYKKRQLGYSVPETYEFRIQRKNGEIRDVEISSSTYYNSEGEVRSISQLLDITERNQAFAKLKNEQLKAQKYLDIAAFMIISIDINGTVKLVNKKACEILGYSEVEIIGKNWFDLCLPKHIKVLLKSRVAKLFETRSTSTNQSENVIQTKDGKERTIYWHSTILFDENGNPNELLSSGEDITDKINSLKIINQSKTVAIIWKYIEESNIYPIIYISENVEKLLGYTSGELVSNQIKYIDLIHPDDLPRVLNEVDSHTKHNDIEPYTHDNYRIRRKDGHWIWVEDQTEFVLDDNGKINYLSGILIDVTEKKQNLELIQSSEKRYKTVFYSNMDGMVIFNESGKIVEVNDVVCNMYGYTREELINRKDHLQANIGSNLELPYVKKHLKNHDTLSTESLDTRKDGSRFHVNSKLKWINYNNENHILAIIRDISDKKAGELELIKAKEKAEESDQLKSSFLANMSHEIRTPMNSIIGFSNLLEESDIEEDEKSLFISRIKNNSQQLLRLINDIIDISKIEANQVNLVFSEIQMNHFLREMFELFEYEATIKNIEFKYECHDMDPIRNFKSDINRLTQIISNLMINALKFTPEGGHITLGCYPSRKTKEMIAYVKDTGIGIAKDAQKHIFQRFRQAHDMTQTEYGGTGLGLSIVKGLLDSMKGRIWLDSEEGSGSQFFIALPHNFTNEVL